MSKQLSSQKFIFKIHSSRLRKSKWNLTLPLSEARRNDEVISLSDSQMMRWIDELNKVNNLEEEIAKTRKNIRLLKQQPTSLQHRREIKDLYAKLDSLQYKPDYMCLIIDKVKDYTRACKGFKINGIKYVRLLGTNGGVKNETIVFVSERLAPELKKRIDNGRNPNVELIPAKFEAYRALTCSGSIPVSMPKGILVVNDCYTEFHEDVISLNDEGCNEPAMEYRANEKIELNESDGYGLMLPSLAKRWSDELGLDYVTSGVNTRFSWEKGMVFCFDFLEFADKVAHKRIVKDAWGNEVDISEVELILTTSMVKLWDSYLSVEHYLRCCIENHYTFGIAKTCPKELEKERNLNYQFIQSYDLSDEQVDRLIQPTIDFYKDILSMDYGKALLFLNGTRLNEENVKYIDDGFVKAMMIEPSLYNDPFVKKKIYGYIKAQINEAKIGVIKVHGNYSIVSGDPYSLCQSIFEIPVTGLLKKGEIYNKFWVDEGSEKVVCFRAPMTCHNNIRLMNIADNNEVRYWYQYMTTCTLFNSWDSSAAALNGMDKDGDLVLTTDNEVLVDNHKSMPTIMCVQRKAKKTDITEDKLIQSNIDSFGDDIGKTTNWITSMFDVKAGYDPNSEQYKVLDYRIKCGQLFQQNAIDKAKGIVCKPMPKEWYDRASNRITDVDREMLPDETIERKEFNLTILADKKPYFMTYIYPSLKKQYDTYIKNTNKKCVREFRKPIETLLNANSQDLSEAELEFVRYYYKRMPVGINPCVMNRICKRFEEEFDDCLNSKFKADSNFDYSVLKSGADYTTSQYNSILKLYKEYSQKLKEIAVICQKDRLSKEDLSFKKILITQDFKRKCFEVCSNSSTLCDIMVDMCYSRSGSKHFVWDICSHAIIKALLNKNNNIINYPVLDNETGNINFEGNKFSIISTEV